LVVPGRSRHSTFNAMPLASSARLISSLTERTRTRQWKVSPFSFSTTSLRSIGWTMEPFSSCLATSEQVCPSGWSGTGLGLVAQAERVASATARAMRCKVRLLFVANP